MEFIDMLKLLLTEEMACMAVLFWYTGFNQPYQVVTFADRFFTESTLGLMLALFYTFELIGAYVVSVIVDNPTVPPRTGARRGYTLFAIIVTLGYLGALWMEADVAGHPAEINNKATIHNVARGSFVMCMWGFSDAIVQAMCYWQLGITYTTAAEQARAVGFYKMVQSAGWTAGFALSPTHRLAPTWQCIATAACYVIGLGLAKFPDDGGHGALTVVPGDEGAVEDGEGDIGQGTTNPVLMGREGGDGDGVFKSSMVVVENIDGEKEQEQRLRQCQ